MIYAEYLYHKPCKSNDNPVFRGIMELCGPGDWGFTYDMEPLQPDVACLKLGVLAEPAAVSLLMVGVLIVWAVRRRRQFLGWRDGRGV